MLSHDFYLIECLRTLAIHNHYTKSRKSAALRPFCRNRLQGVHYNNSLCFVRVG